MTLLQNLIPLVIFLLLGAVFSLSSEGAIPEPPPSRTIKVTASQLQGIRERWTAQWGRPPTADELRAGVEPRPDVATTIQERTWSSPIWYTP